MRDVRDAIRREREREPGDEPGGGAPGQLAAEQEHAEPGQRERREEQQVVAEDRILRRRVDRQDLQRLRQEVLGVGERQRMRREDVRAPPAAAEMRGVPRQHPRREQRIAEIARDVARQPRAPAATSSRSSGPRTSDAKRKRKSAFAACGSAFIVFTVVAIIVIPMQPSPVRSSAVVAAARRCRRAVRPGARAIDRRRARHARSRPRLPRDRHLARRPACRMGRGCVRPRRDDGDLSPRDRCAGDARRAASPRPTTARRTRRTALPGRPTATRSRSSRTRADRRAAADLRHRRRGQRPGAACEQRQRVSSRSRSGRPTASGSPCSSSPARRRPPARSLPTNPTPASSATQSRSSGSRSSISQSAQRARGQPGEHVRLRLRLVARRPGVRRGSGRRIGHQQLLDRAALRRSRADSGKTTSIWKPPLQIAGPRWSPDGKSIAVIHGIMSDEGPDRRRHLCRAFGGQARRRT